MSADSYHTSPAMTTVAVAVKGDGGSFGELGSRRAVQWAVENLMPNANRFVLIHVVPPITSIPTPSGDTTPIEQLDAHVVEMYMQDRKLSFQEIFLPFKKLCKRKKMETLVLEGDNTASALLKYVTDSGVSSLVLGSSNFISRTVKDCTVTSAIVKIAPETCKIYVVPRYKLLSPPATPLSIGGNSSRHSLRYYELDGDHCSSLVDYEVNDTSSSVSDLCHLNSKAIGKQSYHQNSGNSILEIEAMSECSFVASTKTKQSDVQADVEKLGLELNSGHYSSSVDCDVNNTASSVSDVGYLNSIAIAQQMYLNHSGSLQERDHQNSGNSLLEVEAECPSVASAETKQSDEQAEVEQLGLELMHSVCIYNPAFEDLVHEQNEVPFLSSECLEEARQVNAVLQREEVCKKIAAEEKTKHLEAVKKIDMARNLFPKEAYERHIAQMKVLRESMEEKKIMDALLSDDRRCKMYTRDEIEIATDFFSETKMIGEGSYGKVYRCDLDKTPVAVKVLCSDASEKKEEFLTEIEVLCQLRHPHIVLLLGACPEIGCLVFEFLENGSLEDFVSDQSSRHPLPWFVRFRIAFEVACGLAFLHNSKPDPIIHQDLKPGTIFLDRNYVSRIGDVGLAKLVSDVAPDSITEYRASIIAGSFYYMDPEYQRTGTVQPKSDLYAFGIIVLQLLAAQPPNGLLLKFENAISSGSLSDILDKSIPDWPLVEAKEMAQMALKCAKLQCRDRPDLETEVLPLLKKLADMADTTSRVQRNSIHAPNQYFCPILQEVMEDPYVAADGFTYEHRAIKAWLERHSLSPVTKLKLPHKVLIPNHTLRCAIEDWRSSTTLSSG